MHTLEKLLSYRHAISLASRGSARRAPQSLANVLSARFNHQIGPRYHSLFRFHSRKSSDWQHYILDTEMNPIIRQVNGKDAKIARDKLAFTKHCRDNALPTIPVVNFCDPMHVYSLDGTPVVKNVHDWTSSLEQAPDCIFIKLIAGAHGSDGLIAFRDGFNWVYDGICGNPRSFYQFCMERFGPHVGWMTQPIVKCHASLAEIMPPGVLGTIRIISFLADNKPTIILPMLRIPVKGNVTDNFSEGSTGNLVAPIDLETGKLGIAKGSQSRIWPDIVDVEEHPDTHNRIEGREIPFWVEARNLILNAQSVTPQLRTIGWDIAITETGPIIVEANGRYDITGLQVAYDRGIRRDLESVITMAKREADLAWQGVDQPLTPL